MHSWAGQLIIYTVQLLNTAKLYLYTFQVSGEQDVRLSVPCIAKPWTPARFRFCWDSQIKVSANSTASLDPRVYRCTSEVFAGTLLTCIYIYSLEVVFKYRVYAVTCRYGSIARLILCLKLFDHPFTTRSVLCKLSGLFVLTTCMCAADSAQYNTVSLLSSHTWEGVAGMCPQHLHRLHSGA